MPIMRRAVGLCVLALLLGAPPAPAQAPPAAAGRVKVATGSASIVRAGQTLAAAPGVEVFEADVLRTGADGRLSVMLKDESRLALGPMSELALTRFAYAPGDQQLGLGVRLARGVLSYVSGLIAKLAPESVRLQTPTSIIGVRGTHVLVKAEAP
jgi:hypothetical protein